MKTVVIVIRGCLFRVTTKQALELKKLEQESIRLDWANNQLP